jgi:hypothetical protein
MFDIWIQSLYLQQLSVLIFLLTDFYISLSLVYHRLSNLNLHISVGLERFLFIYHHEIFYKIKTLLIHFLLIT